jgi:hypothetical protein
MTTFFGSEIETPYVDRSRDRFIVSLVFGMPALDEVSSAEQALRIAVRDLYAGPATGDHTWCVYDAQTQQRTTLQSRDVFPPRNFALLQTIMGPSAADVPGDLGEPQFDDEARVKVLRAVEGQPWADVREELDVILEALRRAAEATHGLLPVWERRAQEASYPDEMSVPPEDVDAMPDDLRLAYVGGLVFTALATLGLTGWASPDAGMALTPNAGTIIDFLLSLSRTAEESVARRDNE